MASIARDCASACHFGLGIARAGINSVGGYCESLGQFSGQHGSRLTAPISIHRELGARELICTLAGGVVDTRLRRNCAGAESDVFAALQLARRL
jgi:hypothetical protein